MEENVHSRGSPPPQPWASDNPSPTPPPFGPSASASTSQQKAQHRGHRRRGRDRRKGKERPPLCTMASLQTRGVRTATPTPILAQLGGGGGRRRGSCGTPHPASDPGPSPSTATPPCPGGSQDRITDTAGAGRPCPRRGGTKGGRMNGDPPGGSRDARQAGSGRAAAASETAGQPDDQLDARPSALCPSRAAPLWAVLRPGGRC